MSIGERRRAAQKAASHLAKSPCAPFDVQEPHVRMLLEHLPICHDGTRMVEGSPQTEISILDREGVIEHLRANWPCHQPVGGHDGTISLDIVAEADRLALSFQLYLWSQTTLMRRIDIVRVSDTGYLVWDRQPKEH